MSGFITKFNEDLGQGVTETRNKLVALKNQADSKADHAQEVLSEYLEQLDNKIHDQSEKLNAIDDDFADWAFHTFEKSDFRKDKRKIKKLLDRAEQAEKRSNTAFKKALHSIDRAEREMLRSKIAHADAGVFESVQSPNLEIAQG